MSEPPLKRAKEDEGEAGGGEQQRERPPELEKFWKTVQAKPSDFTAWTYLLQYVDTNGEVWQVREAYDAFLRLYPYCYGYWKKYADYEKRKGDDKAACLLVFERGLAAVPLSVDLWLHYLSHVKGEHQGQEEYVREQFERAVLACGREWRSDKLWDAYVKWERNDAKNAKRVLALYDRILTNPTQGLAKQFDMFKEFMKENNPKDLLGIANNGEDESSNRLRESIIGKRQKVLAETVAAAAYRKTYEDAIKRPYFHVKPLERGQLKNWDEYLDCEIHLLEERRQKRAEGDEKVEEDTDKVRILFERCLIACALYEDFWLKYICWLKQEANEEGLRDAFVRATKHHLPNKVDVHVQFAALEEIKGNHEAAGRLLADCHERNPDHLSLALRRINFERRRGNADLVHNLYRECIERATAKRVKSELAIKYARFLRLHLGEVEKAKRELEAALEEDETNPKLYLQLLDVTLTHRTSPAYVEDARVLLETAVEKVATEKERLLFSQRLVEFMEDFSPNILTVSSRVVPNIETAKRFLYQLTAAKDSHEQMASEMRLKAKRDAEELSRAANGEAATKKNAKGTAQDKEKTGTAASAGAVSYGMDPSQQQQQQQQEGQAGQYDQYYGNYAAYYGNYAGYGGSEYGGGHGGASGAGGTGHHHSY